MHTRAATSACIPLLAALTALACDDTERPIPAAQTEGGASGAAGAGGADIGCNGSPPGVYDVDFVPIHTSDISWGSKSIKNSALGDVPKQGPWQARFFVKGDSGTLQFGDGPLHETKAKDWDACGRPNKWTAAGAPPGEQTVLSFSTYAFDATQIPSPCPPCPAQSTGSVGGPIFDCAYARQAVRGAVDIHPPSAKPPVVVHEPPPLVPWRSVYAHFPFPIEKESVGVASDAPSGVEWAFVGEGRIKVWFRAWDEAGAWPVRVHAKDTLGNVLDGESLGDLTFTKVPKSPGTTFAFDDAKKFAHGPRVKVLVDAQCPKGCAVLEELDTCTHPDDDARLGRWLALRLPFPAGATKVVMVGPDGKEVPWPGVLATPMNGAAEVGISIHAEGPALNGLTGDLEQPVYLGERRVVSVRVE